MDVTVIVVPARQCPEPILARTRNAASAVRRAAAAGWSVSTSFAVGGDDDAEVQSILVQLTRGNVQMTARWSGPLGQESLNFDGAWSKTRGREVERPNWTEFSWLIDHDMAETKPLTTAQATALDKDQLELLGAIRIATEELGAVPIKVLPQGSTGTWCRGYVMREGGGLPAMKVRCVNPASEGNHLCNGPCRTS